MIIHVYTSAYDLSVVSVHTLKCTKHTIGLKVLNIQQMEYKHKHYMASGSFVSLMIT